MILEILNTIKQLRKEKKSRQLYRTGWSEQNDFFLVAESLVEENKPSKKSDDRIEKKPVEVFKEIISEVPKLDLTNLDKKIEMVKKRMEVLESVQIDPKDEKEAISFLEARKKYLKNKGLFQWEIATIKAVESLCKKYKLKTVSISGFYKSIPMEGIDELEKFLKAYQKVSNINPLLQLIIDDGGKEDKKDPILLAGSPFGKWYYILGAWDKEVQFVDDLIYKGK